MNDGILNQIASPNADLDPLGAELDRIRGAVTGPREDRLFLLAVTVHAMHYPLPLCGPAADEDNPGACSHDPESDWDEHFEADDGTWCCTSNALGTECRCGADWMCEEYEAILTALTGEGKAGG